MHNTESRDSDEPEASTMSNHNGSRDGIIQQSSSDQCAQECCTNEVNKRPQFVTLMERLSLEEPQDLPVNYCCIYSEHAELLSDQVEEEEPHSSTRGVGVVQRDGTELTTPSQGVRVDKFTEQGSERSEQRGVEDPYQNNISTKTDFIQINDESFYTDQNSEKTKIYFTEGTPYKVSASTSISDLMILDCDVQSLEVAAGLTPSALDIDNRVVDVPISQHYMAETQEGKAEFLTTPLMFSRSSSPDSVSSCEQPSNVDSSVVSEISQVVSGLISPSELPDSPSQTTPQCYHTTESKNTSRDQYTELRKCLKPFPNHTDGLVLDDKKSEVVSKNNVPTIGSPIMDDIEDEYILAACINFGIQCSHQKKIVGKTQSTSVFSTQNLCKIPIKAVNPVNIVDVLGVPYSGALDCTIEYRTEDTPPVISNSNSQTDLSNLSAVSDGSDINILAECIQSGMPKVHP